MSYDVNKDNAELYLSDTRKALSRDVFYENQRLGVDQAIMFSTHRDAETLDRSNWETLLKRFNAEFGAEDESTWHIERFNHWAVGYVEYLIVTVYNVDTHETSQPFNFMVDQLAYMDDYIVLDEDHLSQLESDELYEYVESEIKFIQRNDPEFVNPNNKSDSDIAYEVINELGYYHMDEASDDKIKTALFDLGYIDYIVYVIDVKSTIAAYEVTTYEDDPNVARETMERMVSDYRKALNLPHETINNLLNVHSIKYHGSETIVTLSESTLSALGVTSFDELG